MNGRGEGAALELASAGDVETLVRANGARFVVTDRAGDIAPAGARELGFFVDDTRHLSHYELRISGGSLIHLASESFGAAANQIDLMVSGGLELLEDPQNYLHVRRRQLVDDELCEEILLVNYIQRRIEVDVTLLFGADFADVFEVRGMRRPKRGRACEPVVGDGFVELSYEGLDGRTYGTRIVVSPAPARLDSEHARFHVALEAGESGSIQVRVGRSRGDAGDGARPVRAPAFDSRAKALLERAEQFMDESARFRCDDAILHQVVEQSSRDLLALRVDVRGHDVLAAGIPWFCCPFGRDTLIAAYEALTLNPNLAASSLRALAAFQGRKFDAFTEEEPGKIFHELRKGEMAAAQEIPHSPYYGSIDATPLFVVVANATYRVTSDMDLLRDLEEPIRRALAWIDRQSDDGRRLVSYERKSARGLENQGWKDSRGGVPYPDGRRAEAPIALCEVQGYCADAYARGARMLRALGDEAAAQTYEERARTFASVIDEALWMPDLGRYAYAVERGERALPTVVSNLGHLLWSRVPSQERACSTARLLTEPASFSAFGVRTLAAGQPVYNPLSYHDGTVWPHDNALIAKGFSNYGLMDACCRVADALIAAMPHFRDRRLPELFCGMSKTTHALVPYPVACSPQAWAAAAPFLLLQASLGLHIDGPRQRLSIRSPQMPSGVKRLSIEGLRVGGSRISLRIRRVGTRCHVDRLDVAGAPLRTVIEID